MNSFSSQLITTCRRILMPAFAVLPLPIMAPVQAAMPPKRV